MTSSKLPLTCNQGLGCWAMHRTPFWKTIHHKLLIKRYLIKILYSQHIDLLLKSLQLEIKYHFTFIYNLIQRTNLFGVAKQTARQSWQKLPYTKMCGSVCPHKHFFPSTFIRNKTKLHKIAKENVHKNNSLQVSWETLQTEFHFNV